MDNPKKFVGATSNSYSKVIDKSRTGDGNLKHNATRPWSGATSVNHYKPVKKSATGTSDNLPGTARVETKTSFTHFKPVDKSNPGVPVVPKKWHRKGYSMQSPS